MRVFEYAPAKINLTLEILGRLESGFHALHSLVVFAGPTACDVLEVVDGPSPDDRPETPVVAVGGPFADALAGENLITLAQTLLKEREPGLTLPQVRLEKRIPVAAGLGGGSADAAAYLRLVRRANPDIEHRLDWMAIAARLGADVPVCIRSTPTVMSGIGERLAPFSLPRALPAVLVNPMCPVPLAKTRDVFARLGASAATQADIAADRPVRTGETIEDLLRNGRNDLAAPARSVMPEISEVEAVLRGTLPDAIVRLSGAGPTVFALVDDQATATAAAGTIRNAQPNWWVAPVELGPATES